PDPRQKSADPQMAPRELFQPAQEKRPIRIVAELQAARIMLAVESERQLQEVMVDFWFNHFNVQAAKGEVKWYLTSYERDVIRPHALGKFGDLLRGTATHPATLFYLDNWLSARPDFPRQAGPHRGPGRGPLRRRRAAARARRARGGDVPPVRRRRQGDAAHDSGFAGVLGARGARSENQEAVRVRRERGARGGRPRRRRARRLPAGALGGRDGRGPVRRPAAHRLSRSRGSVGERGRAPGADELRAGADAGAVAGRDAGSLAARRRSRGAGRGARAPARLAPARHGQRADARGPRRAARQSGAPAPNAGRPRAREHRRREVG